MSKLFSLFLAVCVLSLSISGRAFADAYSDGVAAYKAGNYVRAAQLLQTAAKRDSGNADAVFYLGMAYTHSKNYDAARQAFELVLQVSPPGSELAGKARNNITWLTKQQMTLASNSQKAVQVMKTSLSRSSQENYLTHVINNGKIVHFDSRRMPLRVYIANGLSVPGWNSGMKEAVIYAMQIWQTGSKGKVRFIQAFTEKNADIIVRWQSRFSDNILGVSPFQMMGDVIVRSDINLAVYYPDSSVPIPFEELKGIAVHEMGHAIGMKGHSPYPDDIMFFSKTRKGHTISTRDANTIGMLYKLEADVKNTDMSTAMARKYSDLYELGYKAQTGSRPAEAINYYRQAMAINRTMPEAKFNLGALLINEGIKMVRANNLQGARRNFDEATRLYAEILQSPQPPPSSKDNYNVAKNNLAMVNEALQKQ